MKERRTWIVNNTVIAAALGIWKRNGFELLNSYLSGRRLLARDGSSGRRRAHSPQSIKTLPSVPFF